MPRRPAPDSDEAALEDARRDAVRLLRYRPRSTQELSRRLRLRGHPAAVISAVVERLTATGELDDRRFVRLWAHARAHGYRGPRLIGQELTRLGVPRELIAQALDELPAEYGERGQVTAFVQQRLPRLRREPLATQWRRLSQQLARRGFAAEIVEDVLRACLRPHSR